MDRKQVLWAVVLGLMLAITGCESDSDGGAAGSGGSGGSGGSSGSGGSAGTGGVGGTGGTNSPPEATIVGPVGDSGIDNPDYVYDGFDDGLGLWYTDVTVEGLGVDDEDGTLTGAALVWKTNQSSLQSEVLGTGANLTVRLYSDECFGTEHIIRLEVTDSGGLTTMSPPRTLFIWTLC